MESETLAVVVVEDRADEIFDFLYEKLEIGRHNHGIIFQNPLASSTEFKLS
jgi:nitrogen regulatory protein PII